jgi:hypothetical protein
MWALTTYFNPIRYKRRLSNYRIFRSNLHVPLITVELSFDGHFELTKDDADVLIQISGGAILWQKERLLNIAIKSVPNEVENIAWIDCDVLFKRKDWVERAESQLRTCHNVIQLFSKVIYLNKDDTGEPLHEDYTPYQTAPGLVALHSKNNVSPFETLAVSTQGSVIYNPGLGWAAKKDIFVRHGFYDLAIIGAGDLYMANSLFGTMKSLTRLHLHNKARSDSYLEWAGPLHQTVAGKIGYIEGEIFHLWHGDLSNRNYKNRFKTLTDFDPLTDVYLGHNGVWHWTEPNTELAERLKAHFLNRREDG